MTASQMRIAGVFAFLGICLFLTFNKHSKSGYFNYHSEIWADKAGYYVYLPAGLKYGFYPENFPALMDIKTGKGFKLDYENGKVLTKYTCGVALMQLPFFWLADVFAEPLGFGEDGFSPIYHWSVNVAAVFYLVLGLILLMSFLKSHFGELPSILATLSIFLGTNLYYYSIDETGMSHVYSFSLFCAFLSFLQKTNYLSKPSIKQGMVLGLLTGLILLIRPTNILFLSAFFLLDLTNRADLYSRAKRAFSVKIWVPAIVVVFIVVFPQLLYWHYTTDSLISYSYGNEGFNWGSPKLLNTWFSPNNGLFLYSPFYLLSIVAAIWMIKNKRVNGLYLLGLFMVLSYVLSCWWSWDFGCSFGARSFVEYLAVLSIPLAYAFNRIRTLSKARILGISFFALLFIAFNFKMTYSYDQCFYGDSNWDWPAYFALVMSPTK